MKTTMKITLRLANPDSDYEGVAALWNALEPEPITAQQLREWDAPAPGKLRRRTVAWVAGQVVGYGFVGRDVFDGDGRYELWVGVSPGWQRLGIGRQVYDEALAFVRQQPVTELTSRVRDNNPAALRFARRRGFVVSHHRFESVLDLGHFNPAPFAGVIEAVAATGIRFTNLAEEGDTEMARRKLHQLNYETYLDEPDNGGCFPDFDAFNKMFDTASWFRAEGQILAVDGERYVGLAAVGYYANTNSLYNMMTGVDHAYRGRRIALALKLLTIQYAQTLGADYIRTHNDSLNGPMLTINRRLGYQPRPGEYQLHCVLKRDNLRR